MADGRPILVLEELEHALKRNAKIYAEVVGYGNSSRTSIALPSPITNPFLSLSKGILALFLSVSLPDLAQHLFDKPH